MNTPDSHQNSLSLEAKIASEVGIYIDNRSAGVDFNVEPSAELSQMLELYIPYLLSQKYLEWKSEGLDGIFVSSA